MCRYLYNGKGKVLLVLERTEDSDISNHLISDLVFVFIVNIVELDESLCFRDNLVDEVNS